MNKLAICAIAKDEHLDLLEWIAYHQVIGVEHFYIYDNDSTIPIQKTLENISGATIIPFPGTAKQLPAYNDCISRFAYDNQWIAFIDCDEFILPKKVDYIPDILETFKHFGGLQINWKIFASNGHMKRPEGLVIENYTQSDPGARLTKSIVRPKRVSRFVDPHFCLYRSGYFAVSERRDKINGSVILPPQMDLLQVNHYFTKSWEDFQAKVARGTADGNAAKQFEHFKLYNETFCTTEDKEILRFVERTKKQMDKNT